MITSKQNAKFKYWMKLKTKKYRDQFGQFLVFGKHQIEKAEAAGVLEEIITSNPKNNGTLIDVVLMKELQMAETYFDTCAVCRVEMKEVQTSRVLILDDIQDPDNLGALLRSAAAFGFTKVFASHKSADFYNEKTIRAAKGSIFDISLSRGPILPVIKDLKAQGYAIIGADAHGNSSKFNPNKVALILGNEGHGISPDIQAQCDQMITIETKRVESLNVSVAGGILMHQWRVE